MRVRPFLALTALLATLLATLGATTAWAQPVHVAVAANFAAPMMRLATDFEQGSGHKLLPSYGASGELAAQIRNGAPFDVIVLAGGGPQVPEAHKTQLRVGRHLVMPVGPDLPLPGSDSAHASVGNRQRSNSLCVAGPVCRPHFITGPPPP